MPAFEHMVVRYLRASGNWIGRIEERWFINGTVIEDLQWDTLHLTLNDFSADGWEVVSQSSAMGFAENSSGKQAEFVLILRRPKPSA